MVPALPCSFGNVTLFAISSSSPKNEIHLTRCSVYEKTPKPLLSHQRFLLPQSLAFKLFHKYRSGCGLNCRSRFQILSSVGTEIATDEPNPAMSDDGGNKTSEIQSASPGSRETSSGHTTTTSNVQSKRPRPVRKSEMPPVRNEDLVPGASFTGKVRSIQPFGAFVDIGAFTDGLVHVSNLSNEFVKDVGSIVSVGQEVKVKILEANMETGRISLTMRDSDDTIKLQQWKEPSASVNNEKARTPRKNAGRSNQKRDELPKSSKFVKGQVLDGTVKNLTRSGAFVSLPEGEEGFLPASEESEGFSVLGSSSLQVGQGVNVRILRVTRGQVTLTMKKEENLEELNMRLNQGVVHVATNPFELAFRKNKDIAAFLEERESLKRSSERVSVSETLEQIKEIVTETPTEAGAFRVDENAVSSNLLTVPAVSDVAIGDDATSSEEQSEEATVVDSVSSELVSVDDRSRSSFSESSQNIGSSLEASLKDENVSKASILEEDVSPTDSVVHDTKVANDVNEPGTGSKAVDKDDSEASVSQENGSAGKSGIDEAFQMDGGKVNDSVSVAIPEDETGSEDIVSAAETITEDSSVEDGVKETSPATDSVGQMANELSSSDALSKDAIAKDSDDTLNEKAVTPVSEDAEVVEPFNPGKNDSATSNAQSAAAAQESSTKATVSPALVKHLREETGAGMMDCKKALTETGGDIVKAQELLRKKGLASADKRASRATAEGRIGSYIHDSRIGVLIEVNCETDFVSRGDMFKELVDDLAMQVAACPQVQYLVPEDVPEEIVNKEREIEIQKEDLLSKPEQIRSKIVEGRIRKRLEELALLEQPYIKNDKLVVKDLVKQTIATIGENIKVRRFVRFNLGEGLEKKSQDFAVEVAAQTAARLAPAVQEDKPADTTEMAKKPQTVAVSAALVKQLREETGAGMMDCKKALTETGADLEKAQEYLRKKGLSSADKKSSRLAAEGRISSYIHDSRIGVLIEVNSETDFVGRNEKFKELVDDLAMQVAAYPQVDFVSVEDIPESIVSKEREIEMQRGDLKSKPENIREKIVEGRVSKRLGELVLLEQPFIRDDSVLVKDLVKQTVAALGENIRVRRFARFTLGESLE
uniref:Elongation factor Ts, mitochondrial n=1 Tax=Anthurium amnicola TaxID=1678845 RepID=A0A1D1YY78_9ARAE